MADAKLGIPQSQHTHEYDRGTLCHRSCYSLAGPSVTAPVIPEFLSGTLELSPLLLFLSGTLELSPLLLFLSGTLCHRSSGPSVTAPVIPEFLSGTLELSPLLLFLSGTLELSPLLLFLSGITIRYSYSSPSPLGVNIALGKPAYQTSTHSVSATADRAVDGNTNTNYFDGSCTHTETQDNPSWWVDLGQSYVIGRVVIFNRQDCCPERLNPFNIHIGDSDQVSENPKCGGDHQFEVTRPSIAIWCPGMLGRYVGVRLHGTGRALTLCEVQVFPDCQEGNGASYRGIVAMTRTGKQCQRWDSQTPHAHTNTPANHPSSGLEQNYCRNPDGYSGVWCYTTDPCTRFEHCAVPVCGVWLMRDPSWVVDSTGTPWVDENELGTYDAAKALDGNTGTYWNPQGIERYHNNWYIALDLATTHTLTRIAVNSFGDTTHDMADFTLQKSQVGGPHIWEDVATVTGVKNGTDERQEFGGFLETARYWRFVVTRTNSGHQPWLRELNLYGTSSVPYHQRSSKVLTFPSPKSTANYARHPESLSQPLTAITTCLHMRSDHSVLGSPVNYHVTNNDFLLIGHRANDNTVDFYVNAQNREVHVGVLQGISHFLCVAWSSTAGDWKFYVNGTEIASGSGLAQGTVIPAGGVWILGQEQDSPGGEFHVHQAFAGEISLLNVWDRVLTEAEIGAASSGTAEGNIINWRQDTFLLYGQGKDFPTRINPNLTFVDMQDPEEPPNVMAGSNVHIALSSERAELSDTYEIVIGGWNNTKSVIRRAPPGEDKVTQPTAGILSASGCRGFWISWAEDGTIAAGRDGESSPFMQWQDPNPLGIGYFGYSTGNGSAGEFRFPCQLDIDECANANGGCEHVCTNTDGSFQCSCHLGQTLNGDGKNCDGWDIPQSCPTNGYFSLPNDKTYVSPSDESVLYSTAQTRCAAVGGMVAVPRDWNEQEYLVFFKNCLDANAQFWVGLSRPSGTWVDSQELANAFRYTTPPPTTTPAVTTTISTTVATSTVVSSTAGAATTPTPGCSNPPAPGSNTTRRGCSGPSVLFGETCTYECRSGYHRVFGDEVRTCAANGSWTGSDLQCQDINECTVYPWICGRSAECINLIGAYDCRCTTGYTMMSGGCIDDDECSNKDTCSENAYCVNLPGTYQCVCLEGFTGNGTTCTEIVTTTTPASLSTVETITTTTEMNTTPVPPTSSTSSMESSTSAAADSTTSVKTTTRTTEKGDDMEPEETTTRPLTTPTVTKEPLIDSSTPAESTISTLADLQYDRDNPASVLDLLLPHSDRTDEGSSKDGTVGSTTCTDAMTALARLSRTSGVKDSTDTMANLLDTVITLCGTLPLDAQLPVHDCGREGGHQADLSITCTFTNFPDPKSLSPNTSRAGLLAEGGNVVGAMTDSIKQSVLRGASMEELTPTASAVVDTVASLMASGGAETVSAEQEDVLALDRLPPRKRQEFREEMEKKRRQKQEKRWAYQRDVTLRLKKDLDSIADALLNSKGSGGRVEMGSKSVQMVLEKTSGLQLGEKPVSSHSGRVMFPSRHGIAAEGLNMKVVGFDRNPFVWDDSARDIKSSVLDIELKQPGSGGGKIEVKDLPEEITVELKNTPDLGANNHLVDYKPFTNDTMVYRTFNARRNQTYGVTVSLVAPYPAAVMYGKLGDFPNETDHEFRKEFTRDDFMQMTAPPNEDVHTAYTILQPDTTGDNGTEEYTVGLRVDGCPPSGCLYSVDVARLACVFWDPGMDAELGSWKGDGCRVSPASTLTHTLCLCNHLTAFGTSARTEPNKIHFNTVFTKFDELVNNYAVWTTMVVTMGLYLFMLYPARREDMKDQKKWKIKNVHGNRKGHRYRYLMRVDTGHDWGAGTRSKVSFQLTGDEGSTGPRAFQQDGVTFQSGSVDTFLLTSPEPVGEPGSLAVWHDNSGQGRHASWCLERVEVIDLQTFKRTLFVCDSWLGVEHGDGCLRRTLPPTAETDVSLGQRFSLKLREKFKDGHVWLSVVTSRARSYFSRVQRLSCCLCLLYCKMVTSAMWFRGTEQGTSSAVVSIGPVELTEDTLWVSLMTTLQVFPINFIIAQIFGRRRPKTILGLGPPTKKLKELRELVRQKGAPKSSGAKLPYWFLYVGWTLLVLTTLASGFFLLLYSMEWGRDKSIQWLTAFGLSFLQSMVVVQPAQAVLLTLGATILCACRMKKKDENDKNDKDEDVEAGKSQSVDETLPDCPRIAWSELEETDQLKQQRAVRKGWLQLTHNGKQCMLGIIIIAAALLMVHETWSPAAAGVNQGLKDSFSDGINEIQTQHDVLPWMEGTLARKLYRTQHYNGEDLGWEDRVFITDMPAYRLGPSRLGQFRALSANCDVQAKFLNKSYKTCVKSYGGVAGEAIASFPESKPVTSFGRTVHGTRGSYGGPGYSVSLGETEEEMMEALKVLKANRWIDRYTAALVLDLSLYHVNANLFSTVSVLFEFPPSAGAIASLHVSTFPLASPGIAPTILLVAKAVFTVCLVIVIVRVVKMARQEGMSFLLQVWTIVDVASVVMSIYIIVATVFKDVLAGKAKALISQQLAKDNRTFVDLFGVAFWSDQFTTAAAMVIWFNLVKICSLLRVSSRVRTYLDVLIKIRMKLLGSFIIFLLIVTGFSMSGHLLFCPYVAGFRSLSRATASLAVLPWEEISYDALATANETVGPLFLFVAKFSILYLLLSFTAAVFVSVTSGLRGAEGRGRVAAAQQRKKRLAQAAKETRNAAPRRNVAPTVRNTRHYCNCDETNECYGQVHSTETQV
ncbi:hypothetical protein Bbelb_327190 [Branchiostoma belcheri]|nr:hypothetical protein Bbelb_327190 [Branchiostoma belcheri]